MRGGWCGRQRGRDLFIGGMGWDVKQRLDGHELLLAGWARRETRNGQVAEVDFATDVTEFVDGGGLRKSDGTSSSWEVTRLGVHLYLRLAALRDPIWNFERMMYRTRMESGWPFPSVASSMTLRLALVSLHKQWYVSISYFVLRISY